MFGDIQEAVYDELEAIREALGLHKGAGQSQVLKAIVKGQAAYDAWIWLDKQPFRPWLIPECGENGKVLCSGAALLLAIRNVMVEETETKPK